MAMLNYQQESALFRISGKLLKTNTDYDYFEMLDLFRQLEYEGYVNFDQASQLPANFVVAKTMKGRAYHYNWVHSEFR